MAYSSKVNPVSINQLNGFLFDECRKNSCKFVDDGVVSKIDPLTDGIHMKESDKRIIVNNLINSLYLFFRIYESSKLESLSENTHLSENTTILILTETKPEENFLISKFLMDDFFKSYRCDRNKHGGGIMVYIRDAIPSKILEKHSCPNNIE